MERFILYANFIIKILKEKPIYVICTIIIVFLIFSMDVKWIDDFYEAENGHYYQLLEGSTDWDAARKKCIDECGHLVTIGDEKEQRIVEGIILNQSCWIGAYLNKATGNWEWVTKEEFGYTNWDEGEPNNRCGTESVGVIYYYGKWNDGNASGSYLFPCVCEWEHKINFRLFNEFSFGIL